MFKQTLGILAIIGLFNILLCYQLNKQADNTRDAVYAQSSDSALGFIWSIFDEDVHAGSSVPQKTATRYLAGYSFNVPLPFSAFFKLKASVTNLLSAIKLIYPQQHTRIKLLPENQNFLFRLKPF